MLVSLQETEVRYQFQSHNGAIAAQKCKTALVEAFGVSIPQWCDCCEEARKALEIEEGFNPTMVRLLPVLGLTAVERQVEFQSHNGAIAAGFAPPAGFTSFVSIPQWCDCCNSSEPPAW